VSKHWNPRAVSGARTVRAARNRRRQDYGGIGLMLVAGLFLGTIYFSEGEEAVPADFAAYPAPAVREAGGNTVDVIDGDTFRYGGDKIRIADIDTPEVDGRCPAESELAAKATQRLTVLLAQGPFTLERVERDEDRYGRKLRIVTRGGRSIGDQLVAEGLARTWSGRREPWCANSSS
jgi:endonuclease YncB( thermonuclease family)